MGRRFAALGFAVLGALGAWLGCNSLLGIDDAVFVPLDGGTTGEGGAGSADGGPIMPTRRTVRVPRGETRTLPITIDLGGKPGPAVLVPEWVLPSDVQIDVRPDGDGRFVLTLVASASATVDQPLVLRATAAGAELGRTEVRVLVGAPGTLDKSFGEGGTGSVLLETASSLSTGLAVAGRRIFVADDRNKVWDVPEDGIGAKVAWGFALETDCLLSGVVADPPALVAWGDCFDKGFLAEVSLDAPDSSVPTTTIPESLVVGARWASRTWVLAGEYLGTSSDVFQHPDGGRARVWLTTPEALFPRSDDGGLVAIGADDFESFLQLARLAPSGANGPLRDAGYFRIPLDGGVYALNSAAQSASGTILTATQNVEEDDVVEARTIDPSGRVAGFARIRSSIQTGAAGDVRDRFVVVSGDGGAESGWMARLFSDAGVDPGFTGSLPGCSTADTAPLVAIDEDGMIVVRCGGTSVHVYRVWP